MPKNKGKFHQKEEGQVTSKGPQDELVTLTDRAIKALSPHFKKIAVLAGACALVIAAINIYNSQREKKRVAATRNFGEAMQVLKAPIDPEGAPPVSGKKDETPRFKTPKERGEAALAKISTLRKEHASAQVALQAQLAEAGVLFDLGRYDEAIAAYKRYLEQADSAQLRIVAREGLGLAIEAKALAEKDAKAREAGLSEALKTFEQLQPDENGFYREMALYHQARLKATLGDRAGATALYKQIVDKFPSTWMRAVVTRRMELLEQKG
ncbi:MAG: tetratricopeptide repeat protein [Deltaproteobacteria bacterium]|nr:tetratricopeptide repeat protein [Deltaproteobacteria bacterium]